jgi:hypothetical protein
MDSRLIPNDIVTPFMQSFRQEQIPLDRKIPVYWRCMHVRGANFIGPMDDYTAFTEVHVTDVPLLHWYWPLTGARVAFGLCKECMTFHYACWEQEPS